MDFEYIRRHCAVGKAVVALFAVAMMLSACTPAHQSDVDSNTTGSTSSISVPDDTEPSKGEVDDDSALEETQPTKPTTPPQPTEDASDGEQPPPFYEKVPGVDDGNWGGLF